MTKGLHSFLWTALTALLLAMPVGGQAARVTKAYPVKHAVRQLTAATAATSGQRANRGGEVVDDHGIIVAPADGESKLYERTGQGMFGEAYDDGVFLGYEDQDGTIEIVECADGTVYIKDILCELQRGYWVKGTKSGNTITVPTRQTILYDEGYDATVSLRWAHGLGDDEGTILPVDDRGDHFTFTIGTDGSISLEGTTQFGMGLEVFFMGAFWDDNDEFSCYGDALTKWLPIVVVTQVDELPYLNTFNTLGEQRSFTIVDGNGDGSTWTHWGGHPAHYGSEEANDEWLMSPAIKLEAGKNYRVAIDAFKNDLETPKTVEVKLGTAPTAEAMTQQVIAPTSIDWLTAKTLEQQTLKVSQTGYYHFGIHDCSEPGGLSLIVDNFLVELSAADGAPAAITDLTLSQPADKLQTIVSFTAPATAVDGSTLTANLTKIEVLRDGAVVKTVSNVAPGSAQQVTDDDAQLTVGNHRYEVLAYNAQGFGLKGPSASIFLVAAQDIPYTVDFTDASILDQVKIIDANGDGTTWMWNDNYGGLSFSDSYDADGDDYLVVMPVKAEAGHNYKVTFTAHTSYAAERFEVVAGTAPEADALTITAIETTAFQADEPTSFEGNFTAPADGLYYVAIHALSDMYNTSLIADQLTISAGAATLAPAAVTDLAIAAADKGEKKAIATFTAPATAVNGTPLTGTLTHIDLYCDGELCTAKQNVAVGSAVVMEVPVQTAGEHTFQVQAVNDAGVGIISSKVKAWIGQDLPGSFYGLKAVDNGTSVDFSWTPVSEGQEGRYFNPDDVEYQIWTTAYDGWSSYTPMEKVGAVKGADHYTLTTNTDEGQQQWFYWSVVPVNDAGAGYPQHVGFIVGAPYSLPFKETVEGGQLSTIWNKSDQAVTVSTDEASDGDGAAIAFTIGSDWDAGEQHITTGKLGLNTAAEPALHVDVKALGVSTLKVLGTKAYGEPVLLQEVPLTDSYAEAVVPLSSIKDERFSTLTFVANFVNPSNVGWFGVESWGDVVFIDNIRIVDDAADGIGAATTARPTDQSQWYTIDGRRLAAKPAQKGIYVVDGRKVVVK